MLEELLSKVINSLKSFFTPITSGPKTLILPLLLGSIGLMLFGYGLIQYISSQQSRENSSQAQNFTGSGNNGPNDHQPLAEISTVVEKKNLPDGRQVVIDIEGAVQHPGVYSLSQNSRVQDALISSGGFSENADRIWIAKNINLAMKISDGQKVYIPAVGESQISNIQYQISNENTLGVQTTAGLISINSATVEQLDSLPGVGAVTANKIVAGRPYNALEDLITKKVVSKSVFEKIKGLISL